MAVVKQSRLIFVDSEVNTTGNRGKAKILVPNHPFSVGRDDRMRLTLAAFEMRRSWYNINATNNTFYVYTTATDTYVECVIASGSYDSFAELAAAIQAALQVNLASATCTYADATRRFTFVLTGAAVTARIVCFQVKVGTRPVGVSEAGFFSDVHEILGCTPSRTSTPVSGAGDAATATQPAPFPAQLNTLEAIYLRTNLLGGNFQTYGHERYLPDSNSLTETQIFARIPLTSTCYQPITPFITYEDQNALFELHLQQKSLDSIELYVTDDKGRLLAEVAPDQAELGLMSFKCVLKWECVSPAPHMPFAAQKADIGGGFHVPAP